MNINRLLIIALVLITSCSRALPTIIGESSSGQSFNGSVSAVSSAPGIGQMVETVLESTSPYFFKANYHIKVKVLFLTVCDSNIQMAISSRLGMDGNPVVIMDKHVITCMLGIKIDLLKVLGGLGTHISSAENPAAIARPGNPSAPANNSIVSKLGGLRKVVGLEADKNGIFLSHLDIKPIIGARYSPSRLLLPNLLGGYEEDLANYNVTQQVTVSDFRQNEQAQGTITVKTKNWKSGYNSKHLKGVTFSDTALISVTSNGFENLNSIRAFVPRSFDIRISRDPVAILSIKARIKILDGLGLGQSKANVTSIIRRAQAEGGIAANIFALLIQDYVNVEVELKDQEGIRDLQKAAQQRNTTDNL